MIQLKDDEFFLYLEKRTSLGQSVFKRKFYDLVNSWDYCIISNFIKNSEKFAHNLESNHFKRIKAKNLDQLVGKLNSFPIPELKKGNKRFILTSNPYYSGFFQSNVGNVMNFPELPTNLIKGYHGLINYYQKGVGLKTLEKFKREINKGFDFDPIYACAIKPIDLNRNL